MGLFVYIFFYFGKLFYFPILEMIKYLCQWNNWTVALFSSWFIKKVSKEKIKWVFMIKWRHLGTEILLVSKLNTTKVVVLKQLLNREFSHICFKSVNLVTRWVYILYDGQQLVNILTREWKSCLNCRAKLSLFQSNRQKKKMYKSFWQKPFANTLFIFICTFKIRELEG